MLRPYQDRTVNEFFAETGNTLVVAPTGSGKTVMASDIINKWDRPGYKFMIAHRQELVTQISSTLARDGIKHSIIGQRKVINNACQLHVHQFDKCYYTPRSNVVVASVQTLVRRPEVRQYADKTSLWIIDEAHHVLKDNTWGRAVDLFPNARGCGFTATPIRADKKALGINYDGVFHNMLVSESMVNLMDQGYLCPYNVVVPAGAQLDLSSIKISGKTGDYTPKSMSTAAEKACIYAGIVKSYVKHAYGKRGVTFVPSVKIAEQTADEFNKAGVPAAVVCAQTPDILRFKLVKDLEAGRITMLVNVDLFGEGFDLPAIEVVVMARPTKSYALFSQQLGRALRLYLGKTMAIIIDLVGNFYEHGLPELNDYWTLGYYGEKRLSSGSLNMWKACCFCSQIFERYKKICPHCGEAVVVADHDDIEILDGDLTELNPELLAALRAEKLRQYGSPRVPEGASGLIRNSVMKSWKNRQRQLGTTKFLIDEWCGREINKGLSNGEVQRKFYLTFKKDVLSALVCRDDAFLGSLQRGLCVN